MKPTILIIDDEPSICAALTLALEEEYDAEAATDPEEGLALLRKKRVQLVLLDLKIGGRDGIEVLKKIKEYSSDIAVIMMTAYGSIRSSVTAMKNGAFTYLTKPLDLEELFLHIRQALTLVRLSEEVHYLSSELKARRQYGEMIGKSPVMQRVYLLIEKLKDVDAGVMISGESGTGKELAARAMHFTGKRKDEKFVEINCAAIPEGLLEEEFFGHKKGAFTGAVSDKKGKFEVADKGTVFLDEIGDLPLALQGKLLRVLQQKAYSPIGGNEVLHIDVRVIAATNRNLREMVRDGTFREDLFYRLNVMEIKMPSLRDRKQDLPLLCSFFIQQINREMGKNITGLTKEAERRLFAYDFPGNVRELCNALEYAAILSDGRQIDAVDLPEAFHEGTKPLPAPAQDIKQTLAGLTLKQLEKLAIEASLDRNGGHRKATAEELGISPRGLWNKIQDYGIISAKE